MASGSRRLALQLLDRAAAETPDLPMASITAVSAGGAPDGNALVTVSYLGSSLQLPYLAHYTPTVGHNVVLARVGGEWLIVGRPVGHP